jgi:hypothetical protein
MSPPGYFRVRPEVFSVSAYSADVDRLFRRNVTRDSAESAL